MKDQVIIYCVSLSFLFSSIEIFSQTEDKNIQVYALGIDALHLDEIIETGTFNKSTKFESSVAITTIKTGKLNTRNAYGTGDLLLVIPGVFVENTAGEINNTIVPRGLVGPTTASGGTGFRYVSLQEDGLPVISTLFQYGTPDVWHRADVTIDRLEAIRGGSSSITAPNSPGGIYNFISKEGGKEFEGLLKVQAGVFGNNNPLARVDANFGGPINENGWTYNVGGFYRYDQGGRDIPFVGNLGGQLKFNIVKKHSNGTVKLYVKYLDDKITQFTNIPISSYSDQNALPGWNLNYNSMLLEASTTLPDTRGNGGNDPNSTRKWDSSDGVNVSNFAVGLNINQDINGFNISNNAKFSIARDVYMQTVGARYIPLHFLPPTLPLPLTFTDLDGNVLATTNPANPSNPTSSIGDLIYLTAAINMDNDYDDFMDQLTISKEFGNHSITIGSYLSIGKYNAFWNADALATVFEPNPRPVIITSPNPLAGIPGQPADFKWTTDEGVFGIGTIYYANFDATVTTTSLFLNDVWTITDNLNIDFGIRYESLKHKGKKERTTTNATPEPFTGSFVMGLDGDYTTQYDNNTPISTGEFFDFNYTYNNFSTSLGLNLKLNDSNAIYVRYSRGNKAPDIDFYITNFINSPFEKGPKEKITQIEAGYKINSKKLSMFLTAFYSKLDDIPYQRFVLSLSGESLLTPITLNTSQTIGLELESNIRPLKNLDIDFVLTLQDATYTNFDFYNVGSTINTVFIGQDGTDDFIENFDGNKVDKVPQLMLDITPVYRFGKFTAYFNWRYTSKREYNIRNEISIPDFSVFNGGIFFSPNDKLGFKLQVNNIFNSDVMINPGEPGPTGLGGPNSITKEYLDQLQTQGLPVYGRPLLPRRINLSMNYTF